MKLRTLKYFSGFSGIIAVWISLTYGGILAWTATLYYFCLLPLLELVSPASNENLSEVEENLEKENFWYDISLYLMVPAHVGLLIYFFFIIDNPDWTRSEYIAKILAMGFSCGINGINVAHELGHRVKPFEKVLAKIQLLTSQYMHFIIEHNRGHHKNVSTEEDGSSARRNELVYFFWIRSVSHCYTYAWQLEHERLRRRKIPILSFQNEMIRFTLIQISSILLIYWFFGWAVLAPYLIAAVIGFLLLETINYIEILRHFDDSPQMPYGYPAMVLLALVPFIFIPMMNRQIDRYKAENVRAAEALV